MKKIKVRPSQRLVVLHGDEMAQVAFDSIIEKFIKKYVDIKLEEIDLSAVNRIRTNGKVVTESIDKINKYGVGVKNAGITVNKDQLEEIVADLNKSGKKIDKDKLDRLATRSPNGAIRKGVHGNITREDIPFNNLHDLVPKWKGRKVDVVTMDTGGLKTSHNQAAESTGLLKLSFIHNDSGKKELLHSRKISKGDPWLLATNCNEEVKKWAKDFFARAVKEKRDAYVGLKDTVMPGYDGVMKEVVENVFEEEFAAKFKKLKLKYEYGLIDAQAAKLIVHPPENALWGIPDNTSGRKLLKLVEALKKHGVPDRPHKKSISRMSAGGGDQYGSFNQAAPSDGMLVVEIGDDEQHAREINAGDPVMLMSNEREAIAKWYRQVMSDAAQKGQEIYIGLKAQYMAYDRAFSDVIAEVYYENLISSHDFLPSYMVMRPSQQLKKMIVDPPMNARYPALNLDGDIFSDITAALGGSLATASSIIEGTEGAMLFEAPHGTAPDLYVKYVESKGKEAHFNPSAIIYAVANALEVIAGREDSPELKAFSDKLKTALISTVDDGVITGDLKGKTLSPKTEKVVDMFGFLNAVDSRLKKLHS